MDFKLKNGFTIKINGKKEKMNDTYLEVKAHGYHGDMDYDVNNHTKIYFNDNIQEFKKLITFICIQNGLFFEDLKEEYKKLFKKTEFDIMSEDWSDFLTDYSELHDNTIYLNVESYYVIKNEKYEFQNISLDLENL